MGNYVSIKYLFVNLESVHSPAPKKPVPSIPVQTEIVVPPQPIKSPSPKPARPTPSPRTTPSAQKHVSNTEC